MYQENAECNSGNKAQGETNVFLNLGVEVRSEPLASVQIEPNPNRCRNKRTENECQILHPRRGGEDGDRYAQAGYMPANNDRQDAILGEEPLCLTNVLFFYEYKFAELYDERLAPAPRQEEEYCRAGECSNLCGDECLPEPRAMRVSGQFIARIGNDHVTGHNQRQSGFFDEEE